MRALDLARRVAALSASALGAPSTTSSSALRRGGVPAARMAGTVAASGGSSGSAGAAGAAASGTATDAAAPKIFKGLDGVIVDQTAISTVGKGAAGLTYRGYPIEELAAKTSFEARNFLSLLACMRRQRARLSLKVNVQIKHLRLRRKILHDVWDQKAHEINLFAQEVAHRDLLLRGRTLVRRSQLHPPCSPCRRWRTCCCAAACPLRRSWRPTAAGWRPPATCRGPSRPS